MVRTTAQCIICDHRPAKEKGICASCYGHIQTEQNAKAPKVALYYLTYRGHVVGLYPNGGDTLKARLETRNAEHLPKRKTINLDKYCEGYDRDTIKHFKAVVLSLAHA